MANRFAERPTLRVNAMRDRGVLARVVAGGAVENVYRLQVMNAQLRRRDLQVTVAGQDGLQLVPPLRLQLLPAQAQMLTVTLRLSPQQAQRHAGQVLPIRLVVAGTGAADQERVDTASTFLVD